MHTMQSAGRSHRRGFRVVIFRTGRSPFRTIISLPFNMPSRLNLKPKKWCSRPSKFPQSFRLIVHHPVHSFSGRLRVLVIPEEEIADRLIVPGKGWRGTVLHGEFVVHRQARPGHGINAIPVAGEDGRAQHRMAHAGLVFPGVRAVTFPPRRKVVLVIGDRFPGPFARFIVIFRNP